MKRLIVNADDFGLSPGVNRGVIRAHRDGILSSTSMMVDTPHSAEAARMSAAHATLAVGLHVVIAAHGAVAGPAAEVERQLERFVELTGRQPTHIDTHHDVHRDERLLPALLSVAERHRLPLRGHCGVHVIRSFYGRWDGEMHAEHIGPDALIRLLAAEVRDGFNELCCHPGYPDEHLRSSYALERETELATLCDPAVAADLGRRGVRLATFEQVRTP
jgi:predicted glycoside hydrolase/deacetylase ChbG (UPF0249 family)